MSITAGVLVGLKIKQIQIGYCLGKYFAFFSFRYYINITNPSHNHNTIEILIYKIKSR